MKKLLARPSSPPPPWWARRRPPPTTRCGSTAATAAAPSAATTPTSATGARAATAAGVNKKAVNWNGTQRISVENYRVRDALDCFCTGANWCYIASHSAGNLQIGYALSLYGGSARYKKNAVPQLQRRVRQHGRHHADGLEHQVGGRRLGRRRRQRAGQHRRLGDERAAHRATWSPARRAPCTTTTPRAPSGSTCSPAPRARPTPACSPARMTRPWPTTPPAVSRGTGGSSATRATGSATAR